MFAGTLSCLNNIGRYGFKTHINTTKACSKIRFATKAAAKPAAAAEVAKPAAKENEAVKTTTKPKRPKKVSTVPPRTIYPNGFLTCSPATDVVKPALTSVHITATAANQTDEHEGLFYRVSDEAKEKLYSGRTFHPDVREFLLTMRECSIMVRRPFLELKNYLERANYALPVVRYVLYGQAGNGKHFTLAHALDYLRERKWFILHFPYLIAFNKYQGETVASVTKPGKIDLPLYSVELLQHFASQNEELFRDPVIGSKLVTSNRYEWTKREATEAGESLMAIIDHGIQRPRHASDCVNALLREIKFLSPTSGAKSALVVDMVNALFAPTRLEFDGLIVDACNVSLFDELKSSLKADWKNGACICSVESEEVMTETLDHYMPRRLLKQEGWDLLDPFMPIEVPRLTNEQVRTFLQYYIESKWLQHPDARTEIGQQELRFLSGNSPHELYTMCGGL